MCRQGSWPARRAAQPRGRRVKSKVQSEGTSGVRQGKGGRSQNEAQNETQSGAQDGAQSGVQN